MLREKMTSEFNVAMGQPDNVDIEDPRLLVLRTELIKEECREFVESVDNILQSMYEGKAIDSSSVGSMVKELTDLQYVVSGFASTYGIYLDGAFSEVHQSNMTKLGVDGKPVYREDGKVMKGPNYVPPANMERFFYR